MAEEEFEIDIYGDAGNDQTEQTGVKVEETGSHTHNNHGEGSGDISGQDAAAYGDDKNEEMGESHTQEVQPPDATASRQGAPQQGVKRKEGSDDRPIDPGATTALLISELNWWNTDDEIRGWARQANCEEELKDITFSEHKVNGKCKGQAYIEFTSQQAATATKHRMDAIINESGQPGQKKQTAIYSTPTNNPFRTLPKDAPARQIKEGPARTLGGPGYNSNNHSDRGVNFGAGNFSGGGGGFRGGRGGGFRGGGMNQGGGGGGGGFNRNFSGSSMNAFNGNNMGFNNPMGGGSGVGGFNRGGMMGGGMRGGGLGMRGGRGGMSGVMGAMPMGGMPMGGMAPAMGGMGMMGGGMPGFQGMQPQFNPAFAWAANQPNNDWNQNPHGAKRPRGE